MVGSTTNRISYNVTSASTAPLAVDYRFDDSSWLQVRYVETGAETSQLLTIGTHYTVSGDGTAIEGTVTLTSGFLDTITAGELVIARFTPAFQEVNLEYNTRFPAVSVENQMDEMVMALQDRTDSDFQAGSRAIYLPPNEPASNPNTLPLPIFRAGKFFAFNSDTGAIEALSAEDAAIRILAYYGLEITSEDVLSTISALAPIERFTPPTTSTDGLFGQFAIIPEHVDLEVTGTLTPDITGTLLPWKTENGKIWFSTDGVDPATLTSTPLSVSIGWNGTMFGISVYEYGIEPTPAQGWLALNGNSSTYPNNVTSWLPINTTGQPDIALSNISPSRVWQNHAASGSSPNWREIPLGVIDPSTTHVVIIGNSISVGQGTPEQSWPGQLSGLSFFEGCTFHNLAVNGRSIATMDSTYEDEVAPFHPNGNDILKTYVFLFSDASNNYAAGSSDPLSANDIITHRDSILTKAKNGGCITVHSTTLRRTDNAVVASDEAVRQEINDDSRTNALADFRVDLDALLPNPDDTVLYASGGIHPNNIADTIIAQLVNGVLSSRGTFALPQGPRLSGGNIWREEQRFITGLTGVDDHAAVYDTKGDVSTRIVAFALNGVTNQVFFQANAAGGKYVALYDVLAGAFVWRSIGGNLEIPKCIKPDLGPFADDSAAAAGGIPVGGQYNKTGGTVAWRVS